MDQMRVGIVGFGIMGTFYADALRSHGAVTLAGVADKSKRARAKAGAFGCPAYTTHTELFKKEKLDAVIITLPDFAHRAPVMDAAAAKLHILLEKPLATTTEDAEAMVEGVESAGVKCMLGFANRWSVPFAKAREAIQRGELGEIVSVSADLNDTVYVPTEMLSWAGQTSVGWFLMSHTADLVTWVTGKKPHKVYGRGTKKILAAKGIDTNDVIEALVEYDDGTTGRYTSGWVLPRAFPMVYEFKARFIGSEAAIDIDLSDQSMHVVTHSRYEHPSNAVATILGRRIGHQHELLNAFIRCVRGEDNVMCTVRDGLENVRFIEAVHRSLESGRPVEVAA